MNKGWLYFQDDHVKALDNSLKAASLHRGTHLPGIYGRISGTLGINAGFKEKAIYYQKEAFKLTDDSATYYRELAGIEQTNRNYEKAIELGKKSYAIDSTDWWVVYRLGRNLSFLGQFEESLEYMKKFDRILETKGIFLPNQSYRIGYAYWVNGFKEKAYYYINSALEMLNDLIELGRYPFDEIVTFFHLAAIYAFTGENDKAYENLRLLNQKQRMPLWMVVLFKDDPMFDSIRDEPEFQQIIKDIEAKYQAEHESVRRWLEEHDML